jgi:transposase
MSGPRAAELQITLRQQALLQQISQRQTACQRLVRRVLILLALAATPCVEAVARELRLSRMTVRLWRDRWNEAVPTVLHAQQDNASDQQLLALIEDILSDDYRSGAPPTFTPEQIVLIIALACEPPEKSGRPISHWTTRELADEAKKRRIVSCISPASVGLFLREAKLQPHRSRYWLNSNPEDPVAFRQQVEVVCEVYEQAGQLAEQGFHVVSTDEKTGIQALQRLHPDIPVGPGRIQGREHEYTRHGTLCLTANLEIWCGCIIAPTLGPRRTEEDFAAHIEQTVATDPLAGWVFIADNLNTHQSESLVLYVAEACGLEEDLGEKGKEGVLKSQKSRAEFLSDPDHRIRFVYTPKHTSWLNQIENWFSILVRKLLRRSSFNSLEDLKKRILAFIDYFNRTMAKPIQWLYNPKPPVADKAAENSEYEDISEPVLANNATG